MPDYLTSLDKAGLKGARIGVARNFFGNNDAIDAVLNRRCKVLKAQGAILIDPVGNANVAKYQDSELEVLPVANSRPIWPPIWPSLRRAFP